MVAGCLSPGSRSSRPSRFTLLERDFVIWWDAGGDSWRAFPDVCPHRLVPLSEGGSTGPDNWSVHTTWSFDGEGHCRSIPQADDGVQTRRASPPGCELADRRWSKAVVCLMGAADAASSSALPLVPALEDNPESWTVQDTFRDLPMDAVRCWRTFSMSATSPSPITAPLVSGNAAPIDAVVTHEGPDGFDAFWEEGPRRGKLGSQSTRFQAPQLMWHDLTAKGFGRILTVVYACRFARVNAVCLPFPFSSNQRSLVF